VGLADAITWTVSHLGVLGVFALMVPESACIPIPSEATLLFAGFAVGQGWMNPWEAVAAATAGNLVGSLLAYEIGRRAQGRLVSGPLSCRRLFARHGDAAVFIARVLPLARTFVSLPAGRAGVPRLRFAALTVAGCLVWCAALIALGALVGSRWLAVSSTLGRVALIGGALLLAAVAARAVAARARIG
jgi:membrane protein DedA with SNARE-associated domain